MDNDGYTYKSNSKTKDGRKTNWLCRNFRWNKNDQCRARARTDGRHVTNWIGKHNHPVFESRMNLNEFLKRR